MNWESDPPTLFGVSVFEFDPSTKPKWTRPHIKAIQDFISDNSDFFDFINHRIGLNTKLTKSDLGGFKVPVDLHAALGINNLNKVYTNEGQPIMPLLDDMVKGVLVESYNLAPFEDEEPQPQAVGLSQKQLA